jgi:hypothetical protein
VPTVYRSDNPFLNKVLRTGLVSNIISSVAVRRNYATPVTID